MSKKTDRGMVMTIRLPPHILKPLEEVAVAADVLVADVVRVILGFEVVRHSEILKSRKIAAAAQSVAAAPTGKCK